MEHTEGNEIDLWAILVAIRDKLLIIILAAFAGAILAYLLTTLLLTPTYDSTTKIYVLNKQDESNQTITYSDLQSSTQLTKDYMELVTTRPVLEKVISTLELEDTTYQALKNKISVSTATDGRIIYITVSDKNPKQAKSIADAVRDAVSDQIMQVMAVESVNVVEEANLPDHAARPNKTRNVIMGGFLGFIIALFTVAVMTVMDDRAKSEEDIERYLGLSVLGTIPVDDSMKKVSMKKKNKKKSMKKNIKKK